MEQWTTQKLNSNITWSASKLNKIYCVRQSALLDSSTHEMKYFITLCLESCNICLLSIFVKLTSFGSIYISVSWALKLSFFAVIEKRKKYHLLGLPMAYAYGMVMEWLIFINILVFYRFLTIYLCVNSTLFCALLTTFVECPMKCELFAVKNQPWSKFKFLISISSSL